MNRKLGIAALGLLAIFAALPLSSSASTGGHFVSEASHTELSGAQVGFNSFHDPTLGAIQCEEATLTGTISTFNLTVTEVTLTPTYHWCKNGERSVHIDLNGCAYVLTVDKLPQFSQNTVHLECPSGKSVTITVTVSNALACTLHLKPQTPGAGLSYSTMGGSGSTHSVRGSFSIKNIHITRTPAFFGGCLFAPETSSSAEMTGIVDVIGFITSGFQVGITAT